ncbi:MAG TPA: membrane protein insertion efficiency factor YidD [bacterium]|nr:membrane protein insertion efficiency factor YidD [Dictyoglomota bacterium]HPC77990.1 membrane protein insertion efficiency factor YidD [bacterium]HRR90703.1 membrane protein insertion efficiency factor YidD [bacterium]
MLRIGRIVVLKLIGFYKIFISPLLGRNCRFYPTCSDYTYQAIEKYGLIKGVYLGLKRILRCNPFNPGGYDPLI